MRVTCVDCRFFDIERDEMGKCRRHAPVLIDPGRDKLFMLRDECGYWPYVSVVDWCGEHKPVVKDELDGA